MRIEPSLSGRLAAPRSLRALLRVIALASILVGFAVSAQTPSETPASANSTAAAEAAAAPRIGVATMSPGTIFFERFGHNAIVVDDPTQPVPLSYNFGFFDMAEDGFIGRFVRGEMMYRLVELPLTDDLRYYEESGRGVRMQWLALSDAQAIAMAAALAENAKPENARYRYE